MGDEDPFETLEDVDDDLDVDPEELFTEVDIESVDESAVWEELSESDENGSGISLGTADGFTDIEDDGDGVIVPKESYCQQCEYFSSPPATECTNPGTEILELVDIEHFRVQECPVVSRRRDATENVLDTE